MFSQFAKFSQNQEDGRRNHDARPASDWRRIRRAEFRDDVRHHRRNGNVGSWSRGNANLSIRIPHEGDEYRMQGRSHAQVHDQLIFENKSFQSKESYVLIFKDNFKGLKKFTFTNVESRKLSNGNLNKKSKTFKIFL